MNFVRYLISKIKFLLPVIILFSIVPVFLIIILQVRHPDIQHQHQPIVSLTKGSCGKVIWGSKFAKVIRKGSASLESISADDSIYAGDKLIGNGYLVKVALENAIVYLANGSEIEFTEQKEKEEVIKLCKKEIEVLVSDNRKIFTVWTNIGVIRAIGTQFQVNLGTNLSVSVIKGMVELSNETGKLVLKSGERGIIVKDKKPLKK